MNLKNIENDQARIIGYLIPAVIGIYVFPLIVSLVKILVPVHIFIDIIMNCFMSYIIIFV